MFDIIYTLRQEIETAIPPSSIVPRHDTEGHKYEVTFLPGSPVFGSATTKGGILDKSYLKAWAVRKAIEHVRDNWVRAQTETEFVLDEAENMHKDILQDAGGVGHRTHEIIEMYLNDWIINRQQPPTILDYCGAEDIRVISGVRAAERFCRERHILPIYSELLVASKKYEVAGTLDFLAFEGKELNSPVGKDSCQHDFWATSNGKKHECIKCGLKIKYQLVLVDWKSSNSIDHSEYMMQTSVYRQCLTELTGLKPKNIIIVQLNKTNGDYNFLEVGDAKRKKAFDAFHHLSKTYDWLNSSDSEFDKNQKKVLTF